MTAGAEKQTLAELPPVEELTERQQRGADCVRCGHELATGHVTNLGPRRLIAHGVTVRWFPRACKPRCVS